MTASFEFDPYAILDVPQDASARDIQNAYETIAEHLEGIKHTNSAAAAQLQQVEDAYALLANPQNRKGVDEELQQSADEENAHLNQFTLQLTPSKKTVKPLDEEQVIYLLAEMVAPHGVTERMDAREVTLNLTLVIDQSKSMDDGGRMRRVIAAAQTIISNLTENDVISVVSFNDRASVIIPATKVTDMRSLRARVGMIRARGGTEIYQGLFEGVNENRKFLEPERVNHIILLTDGRTYGDEEQCLALARQAVAEGISISAMGLGTDWNDKFLDQLASTTGGTSTFIKSVNMVSNFMEAQLRNLSSAFAERVHLSMATHSDIKIEMVFKIAPHPQPMSNSDMILPLASLQAKRPIAVLLQLQLPADMSLGTFNVGRFVAYGDIMLNHAKPHYAVSHISIDVSETMTEDSPPSAIVDALSKLTLYRLQEKAQQAMDEGNFEEATRHLEHLATRLIDMGEHELGQQALSEAQTVMATRAFSNEETKKTIKYQTRALIDPEGMKSAITTLLDDDT